MGEKFYGKTVPDLIKAIERLADVVERAVAEFEQAQQDKGGGGA